MSGGETTRIVLSFGSNVGDSVGIIREALKSVSSFVRDMRVSSLYLTAPQDYTEQPDFYNAVAAGNFDATPEDLLARIQKVEKDFGRDRARCVAKGPRTLDIDIILFGGRCVSLKKPDLEIPHRAAKKRLFVLVPLLEILPDAADPVSGELFRDIAAGLPNQGIKKAEGHIWD